MSPVEVVKLDSTILGRQRTIAIWTPDIPVPPGHRYPLLVQQDGQLAFTTRDEELPYGSWGIDDWLNRLALGGVLSPPIVAGVYNSPARDREYFPLSPEFQRYQQFLREQLLPWLEERYPLLGDPRHRALMGSSKGGLVSFALAMNNHDLFGSAACLSPWFEVNDFQYLRDVLNRMQTKPPVRFYLDSGLRGWHDLDDGYRGLLLARKELLRLGFKESQDLDWTVDQWFPSEKDLEDTPVKPGKRLDATRNQHNEFQWRRRLRRPLEFLFARRTHQKPSPQTQERPEEKEVTEGN